MLYCPSCYSSNITVIATNPLMVEIKLPERVFAIEGAKEFEMETCYNCGEEQEEPVELETKIEQDVKGNRKSNRK